MSLDVHNLSPKELTQLNNSLLKYKENSLLKLHNLQRVNHNLIIENTKLKQTLKYGSKERESLMAGFRDMRGQNRMKPMDVRVETDDDYTATVYFKCLLNPSEISDYFSCDFTELQYKVVLVEWNDDMVENASTVVTKQNQLKLKMLQNNIRYLVTVHMYGNNKKLSGQTQFVYEQQHRERNTKDRYNYKQLQEVNQSKEGVRTTDSQYEPVEVKLDDNTVKNRTKVGGESEMNTKGMEYNLNLQVDDDYYITCKFKEKDSIDKVVDEFMEEHKIKDFLKENIMKCVNELKSSGDTIKTVDVSDLV